MLVLVAAGLDAEIVVTAEIDLVIRRRLLILADVQIDVVAGEILVVLLGFIGLRRVEWQRLLRLENRLGLPCLAAIDAGHGVVLAQIVKARRAFRTRTLRAPFRLDHAVSCLSRMDVLQLKSQSGGRLAIAQAHCQSARDMSHAIATPFEIAPASRLS